MRCHICGAEITRQAHAYRRVSGYIRQRGAGGPNQITAPKPTGEVACDDCVDKLKRGLDPGQMALT